MAGDVKLSDVQKRIETDPLQTWDTGVSNIRATDEEEPGIAAAQNYLDYAAGDPGAIKPEEATQIEALTGKLGETQEMSKLTVDDMTRAQAIESIVGNLVKAFAAYQGMASGRDMSGVDVKTGIDWNMALKGKLGVLESQAEELKGQRSMKWQSLKERIDNARTTKREFLSTEDRKTEQMMQLYRLQQDERYKNELLSMRKDKEDEAFKTQLSGTLSQYANRITQTRADIDRLARLPTETIKDVPTSAASVAELKTRISRELGATPEEVEGMDKAQLSAAKNMLIRNKDLDIAATGYLQSEAAKLQQQPTPEGLAQFTKLMNIGPDRLDPTLPWGTMRVPKEAVWEDLQRPENKAKLDKIMAENKHWYGDAAWVNKLEAGEKLTPIEILSLPDSIVHDTIERADASKSNIKGVRFGVRK